MGKAHDIVLAMIPRYAHPVVTELWEDEWTYNEWLEIECCTLRIQRELDLVPAAETKPLWHWLVKNHIDSQRAGAIRAIERTETRHDVAAFLTELRAGAPGDTGKWIHFGLTSSDLVDTAQASRFKKLAPLFASMTADLVAELEALTKRRLPVAGWTHGQPAEPTSIAHRARHWLSTVEVPIVTGSQAIRGMQVMKLSGPVGTFAHNPPQVEVRVAELLGLRPMGEGASQIVPRAQLATWANAVGVLVAACSKIAIDLRLLNMRNEVKFKQAPGQIGSSAMPHKRNPIRAEQIAGLAQLARGYASMLQPLDLWLERDISNSCVERVAVPDLWHVVLHAVKQTTMLLQEVEFDGWRIKDNLELYANGLWSHRATLDEIAGGSTYQQAREIGADFQMESYDIEGDARWFTRHLEGA